MNSHLNFRRQSMPKTLSNPKKDSPVKGYQSSQLKNTINQENNENTSKIEYHPPTVSDPKKALATRPLNKYSFEIAIENALKDQKEEESLVNEIAIADKILGDFNIPNSLLADLEEATFKEEPQQNYITPVKNKNPVNIIKAIHYDPQPLSSAKKDTPSLKLSEKIHQSGAKGREDSARRRSISDVVLSPTYKEDLSKRISARKTEEQTNETSVTLQTESSSKPKPSAKQQPKPQLLDCFSAKSSTNKAKTRFNNRTEGRVGLDKLKSMYSDIFESKKPPKKSQHTKKPSQIPSFIAENKPIPASKPVVNSHVKTQPAKSRSHISSKSFSIATSNHESHAAAAVQSSILDTSLELQLKTDEANSKKPQQAKKTTTTQYKPKTNSISKTNSNLVSAAHSRSSSIGFRSTYQTLSVLNEPTPAPVTIQENAPKRLSKRSKSNVSFNSMLNRRRSSENTSFCVNSLIKQDKNEKGNNTKTSFDPIMEVDDEKTHKYDEAAAKISENTFVVLQSVLKENGVVFLCCQAFFNIFSGLKGLPNLQDSHFEEIQEMMNSPFELFNLATSYKSMVKNGEVPKENVHKALFTLAKIPFCDDDLQGKEYYDLLKFLTIAVEFYKSHKEITKTTEQTTLDMSRFSQKTAVKRPSKNQEKGWEDGNISSVMKYIQEDLYQGDNYKKTEIIEKLKALQNRRSKSIGNASSLLPVSMERFKQRASIHNIVNNVKERIKNHERRKSEHNLKSHSLMYPEDTQVEVLQEKIYRDKVTARDFRGKTKRLLVDHDRFVKKQIKQEIEEYANFNREDALEERARLLDYLLYRDEEEKEFITDMNHEDIEYRRELRAHEKIQRTQEMEEDIQENYKESILNGMIQEHARKENQLELYEKFQDALLARSVKIAKAQSESQSLMEEIAERRMDSFHIKHLSVLQEREKWQSEYSTLSDLIGDAQ